MDTGKANKIVAASIFMIMFGVYILTVAVTLSFWDCGEFIATSYTMGIPHPPGSPLLSLIGRVISIIPFYDFRGTGFQEIAYRINMLSVFLGALTVMLTYLIMVRLIKRFFSPSGRLEWAIVMFSSAMTAFVVGFSDEFWTNAIEIMTYMPALFIQMLAIWLTLRWTDRHEEPGAAKYLFLAAYLIGLGNGIHLTTLLIAPAILLLVFFTRPDSFKSPGFWVSAGITSLIIGLIMVLGNKAFLTIVPLFTFFLPYLIWRVYRGKRQSNAAFLSFLLCVSLFLIGLSVYPTVMVRAGKSPTINEGNPDNWARYNAYINREQYGQGNMYKGMFERNASFSYQFGYMYLRYLIQQFPSWGSTIPVTFTNDRIPDNPGISNEFEDTVLLPVLLLTILLYGFYTHGRRDPKAFLALLSFFLASSVGLILYLNMDNPQVRERTYFFLGSFYIIMYWIGMGIFGLFTDVMNGLKSRKLNNLTVPSVTALFVIFSTIPPVGVFSRHIDPDFTNWQVHNRSQDWVPWDYAYNILVSCEPDAILFTNGDNDTFTVWHLQEVEGIRRDVRVVNLSLLNTPWYILQMKHEGDNTIPVEFSDEYIENTLTPATSESASLRLWPPDGQEISIGGISWHLPAAHRFDTGGQTIGMLRIQDVMIANIIRWVNWERPIYFAVTVAAENKIGLDQHLAMEGMVYRLVRDRVEGHQRINAEVMEKNIFEKYQYRAINDPNVYLQPNSAKLITNYFVGFAQLADYYAVTGEAEKALRTVKAAIEKTPTDINRRMMLYHLLATRSSVDGDMISELLYSELDSSELKNNLDSRLLLYSIYNVVGNYEKASELVEREYPEGGLVEKIGFTELLVRNQLFPQAETYIGKLYGEFPDNLDVMRSYAAVLFRTGNYPGSREIVNRLLKIDPNDRTAQEISRALAARNFDPDSP